jgi:hypothetical protein
MSFIRKIKKGNSVYLARVENYREDGKVKQRVLEYVGKEVDGKPVKRVSSDNIEITSVKRHLDYSVLHQIAEKLSLPKLLGKDASRILLLVYTQILERKALYKLPAYADQTTLLDILGLSKLVDKELYEALDELDDMDFEPIERKVFEALLGNKKERSAMVIDVTDTYFNGHDADWSSRRGKEGRVEKLIQVSLAVTKQEGFPIMHKMYEGNIGDQKIFKDMIADIRLKQFDVIILDRGMISNEALDALNAVNQKVITGLRLTQPIRKQFISTIEREEIFQPKYRVKLKNTEVYVKEFKYKNGRLLAVYNPELEMAKRQHAMDAEQNYDPKQAKYMGYSLIFHTTDMDYKEVITSYYDKDIIEKAYKGLKSTINLHPVRKYRMGRVRAHVKICYLAYAILSYIQHKMKPMKLSAVSALDLLQSVYRVELYSKKEKLSWQKNVILKEIQQEILDTLKCSV